MRISNIIKHIRKFEKTGIISNSLVPFFNQHGKWCEELLPQLPSRVARPKYEIPHSVMQKITLPKARRISGAKSRPVLRTSFITRNDKVVNIPYLEIQGSLLAKGRGCIDAESLQYVGRDFSTDTSRTVYTPNLRTVGGNFTVTSSYKLTATRLHDVGGSVYLVGCFPPNLAVIHGCCIIQKATCMSNNALRYVGKSLYLSDHEKVYFPRLETVEQDLVMVKAKRIEARKLCNVEGMLLAGQAEIILMPNLRFVGGDLNSHSAKEFFHPLLEVLGRWSIAPGAREFQTRRMHALELLKGKRGDLLL